MADVAPEAPRSPARYLAGCWFAIVGFFAGGMVAVGIAQLVGYVTRCKPEDGYPACNFRSYLYVGAAIGAVTLPALVVWGMARAARRRTSV